MALVASSCARFNFRTRARIRLEVDVHGKVVGGNGGNGKRSRQREVAQSGAATAATAGEAGAPVPCALSYILFELEPWQRNVQKHEEDFNGGPAHVT